MMTVIFRTLGFYLGLDINLKTIVAKNPQKKCKFAVAINAIFPQNEVLVKQCWLSNGNIFVRFLVQMKTSKFAFEIIWPLV